MENKNSYTIFTSKTHPISSSSCDVFISYRRIDTERTVAGMLYEHFYRTGLRPFLDSKCMAPGDNLMKKIDAAIESCKVAIAVFSPGYCESFYCLHELALLLKSNKIVIPIFCNVKPSELQVPENGGCLKRYTWALEEAKNIVGLSFDSMNGDWSELLCKASDAVMKGLLKEGQGTMILNLKSNL